MKSVNYQVAQFKQSIFSAMTQLAQKHQAFNLAQGFPDFDGPEWVLALAQKNFLTQKNQYAPSYGTESLRQAISQQYQEKYNLQYNTANEILVTNGATEALYCAITALVNPADEVVLFEPFYDSYLATAQLAKAQIKTVTLKAPEFSFDPEVLKNTVNERTKLLILNNPNNPTGRVFNREELSVIVELCEKYGFYIISDEVYEFLTFEKQHIPLATFAKIKDKVITISSVGKTLSLTGWKIGWVCGSADVVKAIHNVHQFVSFCVAHPLQETIAQVFTHKEYNPYLSEFKKSYTEKRNLLVEQLKELHFEVFKPEGTYFALAKTPQGISDVDYCQKLIVENKVATIPTSAFYLDSKEGQSLVRFCFAKKNETLKLALKQLEGVH